MVSGSTTLQTARQIDELRKCGAELVLGIPRRETGSDTLERYCSLVLKGLRTRGVCVLASALGGEDVERTVRWAAASGRDWREVALELPAFLGAVVRAVMERHFRERRSDPVALVLVGGMTAMAVVRALEASVLVPEYEEDLVVEGRILDGPFAGTPLATKGGAAGNEQALVRAVNRLQRAAPTP